MQDRIPLYPGRVMLTPVPGQENTFDMVRADSPTQEGTQLSKANLLKDATAAMFGFGDDAVPDEVLAFLGQYAQHWWQRTNQTPVSYYAEVRTKTTSEIDIFFSTARKISYSTEISIDQSTGTVSLVNAQEITTNDKNTLNTAIKGKYATNFTGSPSTVYYVESNLVYEDMDLSNGAAMVSGGGYAITSTLSERPSGDIDYVQSTDRNAYPDSGISGDYEYLYLGIPFENAIDTRQFEIGTYVGTGESDSSVTLNFLKAPKYGVLIFGAQTSNNIAFTILTVGKTSAGVAMGNSTSGNTLTVDWGSGNSFVKFSYSSTSYPERRLNASGGVYTYLAF